MNINNNNNTSTSYIKSNFIQQNKVNMINYNQYYELFYKNINPSLEKELGLKRLDNYKFILENNWKPPKLYGLENSERIIPEHYFEHNSNNFKEIDMFYELTKDVRNLKSLSKIQLDYIKTLKKEQIIELLEIYNSCFESIVKLLE